MIAHPKGGNDAGSPKPSQRSGEVSSRLAYNPDTGSFEINYSYSVSRCHLLTSEPDEPLFKGGMTVSFVWDERTRTYKPRYSNSKEIAKHKLLLRFMDASAGEILAGLGT